MRLSVTLCLLGAALVLVGCTLSWGTVAEQAPPLPLQEHHLTGARVAPGIRALGLLGALGVIGIAATRGRGRRAVGLLVAVAGVAETLVTASWLRPGEVSAGVRGAFLSCTGTCGTRAAAEAAIQGVHAHHLGLVLAFLGGILLAAAGLLTTVHGGRWRGMGTSYDAPGARPAEEPVTDKGVWDALDRGDDPTA